MRTVLRKLGIRSDNFSTLLSIHLAVILLIAILPITSCSQKVNKAANPELEKNTRLWQESKILNYNYVVRKTTMGTYGIRPVMMKVRNGHVVSKEHLGEPGPMTLTDDFTSYETVEKAFAAIQEAFDNKQSKVNVEYNREYGYPTRIWIDTKPGATDQIFTVDFEKFEIVKNDSAN